MVVPSVASYVNESCPTEVVTDPANVDVKTSEGDFTIELDVDGSPATTTSFRQLAEDGFYDGLTFSRVVPCVAVPHLAEHDRGVQQAPFSRLKVRRSHCCCIARISWLDRPGTDPVGLAREASLLTDFAFI